MEKGNGQPAQIDRPGEEDNQQAHDDQPALIENPATCEVCLMIWFLNGKNDNSAKIQREIVDVYGEGAVNVSCSSHSIPQHSRQNTLHHKNIDIHNGSSRITRRKL